MTAEIWSSLADLAREHRRRDDEIMWAILAGGEGHQIFGKPIRITVEWPEGLPSGFGFKTPDDFRAFAARRLAELRGQMAEGSR